METRRLGRLGHQSTVLIYGAASLATVTQDVADRSVQEALDAGINHFDVAASYGDAELRLGPLVPAMRDRIFLATKTGRREVDNAWAEINRSLERLRTDHVDLIQMHAVGDLDELDKVTGRGGSLEAALRAREEGLAGGIGITGHGHEAPATHLEALRRFAFDTVLTPLNHALTRQPGYLAAFDALAAETRRQDAGLMIIKSGARRNWPGEEKPFTTWYEPLQQQEYIDATVAWVLSRPGVVGIATPSDVRLLANFVQAEQNRERWSVPDAEAVLDRDAQYSSPFIAMPI
ncbi:MAG: aldo/keto reductase [Streptosporangiales bacterium]|nr:aldo/keto reductase [Streptosporangiales bacterium]MBO0890938.1 aldo/keto reductase [Acidothermales bacterium]